MQTVGFRPASRHTAPGPSSSMHYTSSRRTTSFSRALLFSRHIHAKDFDCILGIAERQQVSLLRAQHGSA